MPPLGNILPGRPWYYGLIIGLVGLAILIAAVHFLLVVDIDKQIASAGQELDELQKRIESGRSAQKKLPQFREEVRRLEIELEKLRRILPSTRNTEEIIKKIKALVDQGNLGLRDLKFPDPVASGDSEVYRDWNISVIVDGTYHNLAILFDRLSNFSRIVNVEKFEITALDPQGEKTVSASFVARTFVYVENEVAESAEPAGGASKSKEGSKSGGSE